MSHKVTLPKYTDTTPNEDSCIAKDNLIAISDGAGGCGVFASDWSQYLVDQLSLQKPFKSFDAFDKWIDSIWEPFYNKYEEKAKEYDGIFQKKFYAEGSCATIAAVWRLNPNCCYYNTYGDSVVFHYSKSTVKFEHSFSKLADFSNPPHLISCKDPLQEEGFKCGKFLLEDDSVVFAASDALSHYIIMMYMVTHQADFQAELESIQKSKTSDATMLGVSVDMEIPSFDSLIAKLEDTSKNEDEFKKFVISLHKRGLLEIDDYTMAILKYDDEPCSTH